MATSSVTHTFILDDPAAVKRFAQALDASAKDQVSKSSVPVRELKDPNEILALMKKHKELYG